MTAPARPATSRATKAAALLALVNAQATARVRISAQVLASVRRSFGLVGDFYDRDQVGVFVEAMTRAVLAGRAMSAGVTEAYLRQQFDLLGARPPKTVPAPSPRPRGIPTTEEYVRPVKTYRYARLRGLDELEAEEQALRRAELIAETDLNLAMRDTARDLLAGASKVTGWRRIIHPELSAGGACGLCVAASDRIYPRGQLMPLHDRCKCEVAAIVDSNDPGRSLNAEDLAELYRTAGGTDKGRLARTRWTVNEHGELGPVLRAEGDHFRDADEVAQDLAGADGGPSTAT